MRCAKSQEAGKKKAKQKAQQEEVKGAIGAMCNLISPQKYALQPSSSSESASSNSPDATDRTSPDVSQPASSHADTPPADVDAIVPAPSPNLPEQDYIRGTTADSRNIRKQLEDFRNPRD